MTDRLAQFIAPARRRPALWRLALGVILCILLYVAGLALTFALVHVSAGDQSAQRIADIADAATPKATLILLATFAGMAAGPICAAVLLHRRGPGTLIGSGAARSFLRAAGATLVVMGASLLLWRLSYTPEPGLPLGTWLTVLPLALAGLVLQTGAEEVLFRGYLLQQLAARFRSPLIWALLPSLAFGALHWEPASQGTNAPYIVASTTLFGLLACDLTARTGSLGAAWGFHFANNTAAMLLVAVKGTIPGLALYLTPYDAASGTSALMMISDAVIMLAAYGAVRWVTRG